MAGTPPVGKRASLPPPLRIQLRDGRVGQFSPAENNFTRSFTAYINRNTSLAVSTELLGNLWILPNRCWENSSGVDLACEIVKFSRLWCLFRKGKVYTIVVLLFFVVISCCWFDRGAEYSMHVMLSVGTSVTGMQVVWPWTRDTWL